MSCNTEYSAMQPKAGETYVHCGHVQPISGHFHTWIVDGTFVRPDGSMGRVKWLACCDTCFRRVQGDPERIQVRGDGIWTGTEPKILKPGEADTKDFDVPALDILIPANDPPLDTSTAMPSGLRSRLDSAAKELGTRTFASLAFDTSARARRIERELVNAKVPVVHVALNGDGSGIVVRTTDFIPLLRARGGKGGQFVADHLERRSTLQEHWTVTIDDKWVDACAYRDWKPTFFTSSDLNANEKYAEPLTAGSPQASGSGR